MVLIFYFSCKKKLFCQSIIEPIQVQIIYIFLLLQTPVQHHDTERHTVKVSESLSSGRHFTNFRLHVDKFQLDIVTRNHRVSLVAQF